MDDAPIENLTEASREKLRQTVAKIERLEEEKKEVAEQIKDRITVLAGSEVDIHADGSLDYPDSLLKELDVVVGQHARHVGSAHVVQLAEDRAEGDRGWGVAPDGQRRLGPVVARRAASQP